MRLENGENFLCWVKFAKGGEGGFDFGWVVAVVVVDFGFFVGAFEFETTFGATEGGEGFAGRGVGNAEVGRER